MNWTKTILAAATTASALGMALTQPAAAAEYKFLLMGALVHPYYGPMPSGIAAAAKEYGISPVPEFTMPQKFDVVEQNAIIDTYVAKGFNGFVPGNVQVSFPSTDSSQPAERSVHQLDQRFPPAESK